MKGTRNDDANTSSVSIRKAPSQKHATDANRYENAQTPTLSLEALRAIARLARGIKERLRSGGQDTKFSS
jgi:hypothetical protein